MFERNRYIHLVLDRGPVRDQNSDVLPGALRVKDVHTATWLDLLWMRICSRFVKRSAPARRRATSIGVTMEAQHYAELTGDPTPNRTAKMELICPAEPEDETPVGI